MRQWLLAIAVMVGLGVVSLAVPAPVAMAGLTSGSGLQGVPAGTFSGSAPQVSMSNGSAAFELDSATSAATRTSTIPAFLLKATVLGDANDLVFAVDRQDGIQVFSVDREGDAVVYGDIAQTSSSAVIKNQNGALNIGGSSTGACVFDATGTECDGRIAAGKLISTAQPVSVASDGAGTAAAFNLTPTSSNIQITCNDPNGCTATMIETGAVDGNTIQIVNVSANAVNFADSAGVSELTGAVALGQYDSLTLMYVSDRWVETAASNN